MQWLANACGTLQQIGGKVGEDVAPPFPRPRDRLPADERDGDGAERNLIVGKNHTKRRVLLRLIRQQAGLCFYCDEPMIPPGRKPTLDHKIPLWQGGANLAFNIVVACYPCNQRKGPLDAETFLRLREHPEKLREAFMNALAQSPNAPHDRRHAFWDLDAAWLANP